MSQVKAVNVEIQVVLGRSTLPMQQLLRMGRGAVIPLDATLVKGSHGRQTGWEEEGPVFISTAKDLVPAMKINSVDVHDAILRHLMDA